MHIISNNVHATLESIPCHPVHYRVCVCVCVCVCVYPCVRACVRACVFSKLHFYLLKSVLLLDTALSVVILLHFRKSELRDLIKTDES